MQNAELLGLFYAPNIIRMIKTRRMKWAEHEANMEEIRSVNRVPLGKSDGQKPLSTPRP
jgi:hypothetical protein